MMDTNDKARLELNLELKALRRSRPKTPGQHRELRERIETIGFLLGLIERGEELENQA
ncbi:hypothetical protein [Endozoicomonas lisbonensis]|uniref:50S ribosomal protein L29 n=1 Tax=Endozoicomonas lisbonensis TaxID=3120522 RepID=A0ABV2SGU1_9GAMM